MYRGPQAGRLNTSSVGEHIVPPAALTLAAEGGKIDRTDDDSLAGTALGLREDAPVVVDDHAPAGPTERRVVAQRARLVGGDDEGKVFDRARAVDQRPPIHRRLRAPRVHVR